MSLGGRLDLNLGYAPSRLLRWGGALGVDFGSAYVERAGIPSTQVAGWQRWSVGPRLGFRFGPHAPLELELGLSYAQMRQLGSMAFIENSIEPGGYRIDDILHGAVGSVLLLYRPGGPGSLVALHGGFTGGWGYEQIQFVDDTRTHVVGLTSSFVVGLSVGN